MKKFGYFSLLFGTIYAIYKICAFATGHIGWMSFSFGILLALYFISDGFNKIFSLEQTRPKLYKYGAIAFLIVMVILFIAFIVNVYLTRD